MTLMAGVKRHALKSRVFTTLGSFVKKKTKQNRHSTICVVTQRAATTAIVLCSVDLCTVIIHMTIAQALNVSVTLYFPLAYP
ncbi:hypothetical protein XENTR_v10000427 [Xenopus tropicalis]|nr:hypothetical protein XENTR_v10000427 [Xenopus tropicalis]